MTISLRYQAEELELSVMERRDHLAILASKPMGKGGVDPADITRRQQRLEVLQAAHETLRHLADRADARRAQGSAAE